MIRGSLNKFPDFFRMGTFIDSTHETLVPFEVISSGCNALIVQFQQLRQGPMEVLLCEFVNDLRHSLFHLLNCLITRDSELREEPKVTGSKVWTIGTVRNGLDTHLGQIVCDKDGVVDWCIVLLETPLTRFEECWPLPTESLPETLLKPQNSNPNPLANQVWCIDFLTPPTPLIIPDRLPAFLESLMPLKKLILDSYKMVEKQSEAFHTFLWHFFQV